VQELALADGLDDEGDVVGVLGAAGSGRGRRTERSVGRGLAAQRMG